MTARSMKRSSPLRVASALTVSALLVVACGGTDSPQQGSINVAFPSTAAAVAIDTLQLQVFDAPDPNTCLELVQKRKTAQPLPKPLFDGQPTPTCSFIANKVPPLSVGYGVRAFMVVGVGCATAGRAAQECLIGCTLQGVGDAVINVDVPVSLFSNTVDIPATKCTQLSAKCSGGC